MVICVERGADKTAIKTDVAICYSLNVAYTVSKPYAVANIHSDICPALHSSTASVFFVTTCTLETFGINGF